MNWSSTSWVAIAGHLSSFVPPNPALQKGKATFYSPQSAFNSPAYTLAYNCKPKFTEFVTIAFAKEKWNAVPLTKFYFLLLSPTPRLDFSFLWVTGFHYLLPFISFSFAKLLAELLAKGSATLWKHTHTSNSWVVRELLKAFLPKEGLWILKARKCFTLCLNRSGFHWKTLKWGALQKGFRCQHFWALYFTLHSHVQRSAPSWVSQIIPTSHIWSLRSEALLPLKQLSRINKPLPLPFNFIKANCQDCVSHTSNF